MLLFKKVKTLKMLQYIFKRYFILILNYVKKNIHFGNNQCHRNYVNLGI